MLIRLRIEVRNPERGRRRCRGRETRFRQKRMSSRDGIQGKNGRKDLAGRSGLSARAERDPGLRKVQAEEPAIVWLFCH